MTSASLKSRKGHGRRKPHMAFNNDDRVRGLVHRPTVAELQSSSPVLSDLLGVLLVLVDYEHLTHLQFPFPLAPLHQR
jgi:hypothetical protein